MKQRRFGRTELKVPAITFGGGWVGGVLIHQNENTAHAALQTAWDSGIDWIDTAAQYGDGVSEQVIGRWLASRAATEKPRISTKFRLDPAEDDFAGQMLRGVEDSLQRLGIDRVEVIYLHNQIDADGAASRGSRSLSESAALGMADTMERLREQGLCDWLGITALGEPQALRSVAASGRFDAAQVYYNMLNPTAANGRAPWNSTNFDSLLKICASQDIGVMGIRIFAGGHLATTVRHGREIPVTAAADDSDEEARAQMVWDLLHPDDGTPAQAALRFGLAAEHISTVVVGLGDLDHLHQAITAETMGPMPADRLAQLETAWGTAAFTG
ncbi:MAG: aldo/keto reductase [Pseudomonadota bacterium]